MYDEIDKIIISDPGDPSVGIQGYELEIKGVGLTIDPESIQPFALTICNAFEYVLEGHTVSIYLKRSQTIASIKQCYTGDGINRYLYKVIPSDKRILRPIYIEEFNNPT